MRAGQMVNRGPQKRSSRRRAERGCGAMRSGDRPAASRLGAGLDRRSRPGRSALPLALRGTPSRCRWSDASLCQGRASKWSVVQVARQMRARVRSRCGPFEVEALRMVGRAHPGEPVSRAAKPFYLVVRGTTGRRARRALRASREPRQRARLPAISRCRSKRHPGSARAQSPANFAPPTCEWPAARKRRAIRLVGVGKLRLSAAAKERSAGSGWPATASRWTPG